MSAVVVNPWQVESINVFNFWCCPECVYRCQDKDVFKGHAMMQHPLSSVLLPTYIKQEPVDIIADLSSSSEEDEFDDPMLEKIQETNKFQEVFTKMEATDDIIMEDLNDTEPQSSQSVQKTQEDSDFLEVLPDEDRLENSSPEVTDPPKRIQIFCSRDKKVVSESRITVDLSNFKQPKLKKKAKTFNDDSFQDVVTKVEPDDFEEVAELEALPLDKEEAELLSQVEAVLDPMISEEMQLRQVCPFCREHFYNVQAKKEHMVISHCDYRGNLMPLRCQRCSQSFLNPFKPKPGEICSNCKRTNYECAYCDVGFPTKSERMDHEQKTHVTPSNELLPIICYYCNHTQSSSIRLRMHIIQTHSDFGKSNFQPVKRSAPSGGFKIVVPMKSPKVIECSVPPPKNMCKICNKEFKLKNSYINHMAEHKRDTDCAYCGTSFDHDRLRDAHELREHTNSEGVLPIINCRVCGEVQKTSIAMRMHIKNDHQSKVILDAAGVKAYKCSTCMKAFSNVAALKSHQKEHKSDRNCAYCEKEFNSTVIRDAHERDQHSEENGALLPVSCPFCEEMKASSIHLRAHLHSKHIATIQEIENSKCGFCQETFANPDKMKKHQKTVHRKVNCAYCLQEFSGEERRDLHEYEAHSDSTGMLLGIKCRKCKRLLESSIEYRAHYKEFHTPLTHEEKAEKNAKKDWKCSVCDRVFAKQKQMLYHKQDHKNIELEGKLVCDLCGFETYIPNTLKSHKLNMHVEKKVQCLECGARFATKSDLRNTHKCALNQKTRQQNEPHPCPSCDTILYSELKMVKHHYMEHGEMPSGFEGKEVFHCEQCPMVFFVKENLDIHVVKEHSNLDPEPLIQCDKCDKKCKSKSGLLVHYQIVHKILHEGWGVKEEFKCEICQKVYTSKRSLLTHKQSHQDEKNKQDESIESNDD